MVLQSAHPLPGITPMKVTKITLTIGLLVACAFLVQAQSGRRQAKPAPAAPVPTPTPEPTPAPKTQQKEAEIFFYVGVDRNRNFNYYPLSYYDAVLSGCAEVLRHDSSAQVDVTDHDLPRNEAIKKSKES